MRVSTNQLQQTLLLGTQTGQTQYNKVMEQMASGKRITRPSDDALGTVRLLSLSRQQSSLSQYQDNIAQVKNNLSASETQLDSVSTILLRVRDLTLEAGNGTYGTPERQAVADELGVLRDSLVDLANARGEDGDYLFAGSRVDAPAVVKNAAGNYVFQGDTLVKQVNVSKGVSVAVNDTADQWFFAGGSFFDDMNTFINVLNTATGDVNADMGVMLNQVDGVLAAVTRSLTNIGGRTNMLDQLDSAHSDMLLFSKKVSGDIETLDYAQASVQANQILLALQATQQSYVKLNNLSLFSQ